MTLKILYTIGAIAAFIGVLINLVFLIAAAIEHDYDAAFKSFITMVAFVFLMKINTDRLEKLENKSK